MQIDVVGFYSPTRLVTFRYGGGSIVGRWRGDETPSSGPVHVELDVLDDCRWGEDIRVEQEGATEGIRPSGPGEDGFILVGRCLEVSYDDVLILSVLNSPLHIDTLGVAPTRTNGLPMSVRCARLEVSPENF
ncbi:hypothetical protein FRACA_2250003 [Frankia canadensis]|uniref:Uncharacterized protein n=1 Tax=Frankia canadensis TaxID=1836972 RepID=A0A2I2KR77_9ACTN|nr:hypothetical protein FRACA_2250003 [Frankia canadensis]SOU55452.1 hypothetical protein FRACA_2250003 [Frankia canadensis]